MLIFEPCGIRDTCGLQLALVGPGLIALASVVAIEHADSLLTRSIFLLAFVLLLAVVFHRARCREGFSKARLGLYAPRIGTALLAIGLASSSSLPLALSPTLSWHGLASAIFRPVWNA